MTRRHGGVASRALRPQDLLAAEGRFQLWLHLHLAEVVDGEVKVLDGLGMLVGVVVQQELCEVKSVQRHLRSGPNTDHPAV